MAAKRARRRTGAVWAAFSCLWALLGWRLWYWQVQQAPTIQSEGLFQMAGPVEQRMVGLPLRPRGQILDRRGRPLSDPQTGWGVAVFPPLWAQERLADLAAAVGMPPATVAERMRAAGAEPFWLRRDLSQAAAQDLVSLDLPGVAVALQTRRYGPHALARHLVGNRWPGGLESLYDGELSGAWRRQSESGGGGDRRFYTAGPYLAAYLDGRGEPLAGLGIRAVYLPGKTPEEVPWDLHLTLDARIQATVEAVLDRAAAAVSAAAAAPTGAAPSRWASAGANPGEPGPPGTSAAPPLRAAAVVIDVQTGDLLAAASRPQFDPRTGPQGEPNWGQTVNRAFAAAYPPGSVFKPLVAAWALEEGLVTAETRFACHGHFAIGGETFHEPAPQGHGTITLPEAVRRSCNIAFIQLGYERMGREQLLQAASRFGLGRRLGPELPGETPGQLPAAARGGEVAMLAFGQGAFLVSPLQMARAYAALATDGTLPPVGLVDRMTLPDGTVVRRPPRAPRERAVSPETAAAVAAMLAGVTDPRGDGTGREAWVPGWGSAGKTGSAEVGGGRVHAWFVGWTPLANPRYAIAVLIEEGGAGGRTAAPLFREIAEGILEL